MRSQFWTPPSTLGQQTLLSPLSVGVAVIPIDIYCTCIYVYGDTGLQGAGLLHQQ